MGLRIDATLPIQEISGANVTQEQDLPYNISSYGQGNLALVRHSKENKDDPKSYCQNNAPAESVQNMSVLVEPVSNGQCNYTVLKRMLLRKMDYAKLQSLWQMMHQILALHPYGNFHGEDHNLMAVYSQS